ncbi:STAS domain-containing protein [uncultured Cellulomonas sp.]|uniref:STAS domain-containing protein n=1 Tax=uncultured Cellulomonas sp. TaxID=189682 RepID=UPI0026161B37|nr:STAS domain-containing protein [uncultured Cellulomonas sp.]
MDHPQPTTRFDLSDDYGHVSVLRHGGRIRVLFAGEIDHRLLDRFPQVVTAVREAREPVDVDCSEVSFFGAAGLRMLFELKHAAADKRLATLATNDRVELVLQALDTSDLTLAY